MNLTQHYLTKNDCYKSGSTITPKGVMVHSIGVAQPDVNVFLTTWNRSGYEACAHAFVHRGGVVQTLPWNRRGWHCYKGPKGSGNNTHISFEICEPTGHTYQGGTMIGYDVERNAEYFAAVYQNAVELTAYLCQEHHLDPLEDGVVICHSEGYRRGIAGNHADVMHWFPKHGKNMDTFRADVARGMKGESEMTQEELKKFVAETVTKAIGEYEDAVAAARQAGIYARAEDVPEWAKDTVDKLVGRGILKGDEHGNLNLTADLLRVFVSNDRAGVYDREGA